LAIVQRLPFLEYLMRLRALSLEGNPYSRYSLVLLPCVNITRSDTVIIAENRKQEAY